MSYVAIARKYRPETFDDIVGQEHVTRTLKNAILRGRVHHAYLFCGARGVGKTTAARALARALNCAQGPTVTPCGVCPSCSDIGHGASQDLLEIDGASNNSVDDIRELRETVRYAPSHGKYKIYLIDEVHMLSNAAFNALLKTLEEPPPHVVFLFATTEAQKIPETILSRVQRFDFRRIPAKGVVERLGSIAQREGVTFTDGALRRIAEAGEGSMRDAQSLLDKVIAFTTGEPGEVVDEAMVTETLGLVDKALVWDMVEGLVHGAPDRCLDAIEAVYAYGHEMSEFTANLLHTVRDVTFLALSPTVGRHTTHLGDDERQRLTTIATGTTPEHLSRLFSALLDVHDQVARAARPRVVLEMAVARLATDRPLQPLGALLGRLEAVERRLRQAGSAPGARPPGAMPPGAPRGRGTRPSDPGAGPDDAEPHPAAFLDEPLLPPSPRPDDASPQRQPVLVGSPAPAPPRDRRPPPQSAELANREAFTLSAPGRPDGRDAAIAKDPGKDAATAKDLPPDVRQWRAFCRNLAGTAAERLTHASGTFAYGVLTLSVPGARAAAEARKLTREPGVQEALERVYGPSASLEIRDALAPITPEAERKSLERVALAEPRIQAFMSALSAEIVTIRSPKAPAPRGDDTPDPD